MSGVDLIAGQVEQPAPLDNVLEIIIENSVKLEDDFIGRDRSDRDSNSHILQYLRESKDFSWSHLRSSRFGSCGQRVEYTCVTGCGEISTRINTCHDRACRRCNRITSGNHEKEILSVIPKIEDYYRVLKNSTRYNIDSAIQDLDHLLSLRFQAKSYSKIGPYKSYFLDTIKKVESLVQPLSKDFNTRAVKKALKAAKAILRQSGFNRAELNRELRLARRKLADLHDYRWRMITLPIATGVSENVRANVLLKRKAVEALTTSLAQLHAALLRSPSTAAIRAIEFGCETGNVHAHMLYFGPYVSKEELRNDWFERTGSYVVDIREAKIDNLDNHEQIRGAVSEITKYITKMDEETPPEAILTYVEALKGKQRTQRYGLFRKLYERPEKVRKEVLGVRVCRDGGKDLIRESRKACSCGGSLEPSLQPSATGALESDISSVNGANTPVCVDHDPYDVQMSDLKSKIPLIRNYSGRLE